MPRLLDLYRSTVVKTFMEKHGARSPMEVPAIQKVLVTMGLKEAKQDAKILERAAESLAKITGQKPAVTRAKKSISAFQLREGQPIGLKVTLRRGRMYEFIDRLFNVALPRVRDFRGYPEDSFDEQGNYSLGIQEQVVFPELDQDELREVRGMNITFVTSTQDKGKARLLMEYMGFPFRRA